jgi:SAM-dependent methyltransferase
MSNTFVTSTEAAQTAPSFIVDIGGEGRHSAAWNVNPCPFKTIGPQRGQPIPRLIRGRAENVPLPDHECDMIIVERTPLSRRAIEEIKRIARPGAVIVLRHARAFGHDPHLFAKAMLNGECCQGESWIGLSSCQETVIKLPG